MNRQGRVVLIIGPGLSGSKYLPTATVSMCDPSWMIFGTIVAVGS
jgi:hypothetical protein